MNKTTLFGMVSAALFVVLPFATSRHLFFGAVNTKYFWVIGAVLVLSAVAALFYFQGKQLSSLKNRPFLWAGLALLGVYWLTALLGVFPERSIFSDIPRSTGVFFLTHIAIFAFILGEFCTVRDWHVMRRTIALSTAVFSFFTILGVEGFGLSGYILSTNLGLPGYSFGNTTFAGTYLVLALIIALIELVQTPAWTRWWYALAGSIAAIMLSPVLLSVKALLHGSLPLGSARASSVTAVLVLVFLGGYWLIRKYAGAYKKNALRVWGSAVALVVVAGVVLLFTPGSFVQEKYIELSTGARLVVWQSGFEAFQDRPVFGWGSENFDQAFQHHFDNRLYQDNFLGEIWFDRAHNVIVDTLVDIGVVGALATLAVVGVFVWVVYRARREDVIGEPETMVLYAMPLAHFLQLQTGFDTIGSYVLLSVLGGYGMYLERAVRAKQVQNEHNSAARMQYAQIAAGVLGVLVLISAYLTYTEYTRQAALYQVFVEQNSEKNIINMEVATSRLSSFESLRKSSLSLAKGTLDNIASGKANKASVENSLKELKVFEDRYRRYIDAQPNFYRARTALAYLLSVEFVLGGDNKIDEAKALMAPGDELSPGNLLTPAMEALLEVYSGNLDLAKQKAQEVVDRNPNAPFGKEVLAHIQKQIQTFPTISVFQFENL